MRRFRSSGRLILSLVVAMVALPAVAWAGKKVISGQQSLQLKVTVHPARAGARGVTMDIHTVYLNAKAPAKQPPYDTKSLIFAEAKGLVIHTRAAPACKESVLIADKGDAPKACSAATKVGHGSVIVNARPAFPSLISGKVSVFNAVDDNGAEGFPKGSGMLVLYIKTSIGVAVYDLFHVVKTTSGEKLIAKVPKPSSSMTPSAFTIRQLDLTIVGSGKHPYITAPARCTGSWPFSLTVTNWFGGPSVTARDRVACKP